MPRGIVIVTLGLMTVAAAIMSVNVPPPVVASTPEAAVLPPVLARSRQGLIGDEATSSVSSQAPVQAATCCVQNPHDVSRTTDADATPSGAGATPALASQTPAGDCGIEPLSLRLTANGYMLDFRFRVLDSEKASALFDRKIKPYLEDQKTGAKLIVPEPPKVGALRTSRKPKEGTTCFMLFANPGRYIDSGRDLTVVAGGSGINLVVDE